MRLEVIETAVPGFLELRPEVHRDARGLFVKVFQRARFRELGLPTEWAETFCSTSEAGVVRGLHFQTPPHDQHKLVWCAAGAVLDVAVDLRRGSPTYGQHAAVELTADAGNATVLAAGLAHGFCVTDGPAVLVYDVTAAWAPEHDEGVRWDSAGIDWPVSEPVLSERDRALPTLAEYDSPFRWRGGDGGETLLGEGRR